MFTTYIAYMKQQKNYPKDQVDNSSIIYPPVIFSSIFNTKSNLENILNINSFFNDIINSFNSKSSVLDIIDLRNNFDLLINKFGVNFLKKIIEKHGEKLKEIILNIKPDKLSQILEIFNTEENFNNLLKDEKNLEKVLVIFSNKQYSLDFYSSIKKFLEKGDLLRPLDLDILVKNTDNDETYESFNFLDFLNKIDIIITKIEEINAELINLKLNGNKIRVEGKTLDVLFKYFSLLEVLDILKYIEDNDIQINSVNTNLLSFLIENYGNTLQNFKKINWSLFYSENFNGVESTSYEKGLKFIINFFKIKSYEDLEKIINEYGLENTDFILIQDLIEIKKINNIQEFENYFSDNGIEGMMIGGSSFSKIKVGILNIFTEKFENISINNIAPLLYEFDFSFIKKLYDFLENINSEESVDKIFAFISFLNTEEKFNNFIDKFESVVNAFDENPFYGTNGNFFNFLSSEDINKLFSDDKIEKIPFVFDFLKNKNFEAIKEFLKLENLDSILKKEDIIIKILILESILRDNISYMINDMNNQILKENDFHKVDLEKIRNLNNENIFSSSSLKILLDKFGFKHLFIENIDMLTSDFNNQLRKIDNIQIYQLVNGSNVKSLPGLKKELEEISFIIPNNVNNC